VTRRRTLELLAGLVAALAVAACGRKGKLEPPPGSQPNEEEKKKPTGS
jgi:predicted small lipoprotein YifL